MQSEQASRETQKKGKHVEWQESGGREKGGARVHEEGEKNEERVSCARCRGATRLFISEKGCKDCSRATPRTRCVPGKLAAVLPP